MTRTLSIVVRGYIRGRKILKVTKVRTREGIYKQPKENKPLECLSTHSDVSMRIADGPFGRGEDLEPDV